MKSPPLPLMSSSSLLLLLLLLSSSSTAMAGRTTTYSPGTPSAYVDVHIATSFSSSSSGGGAGAEVELGYRFRVPASGSHFAPPPPMGPAWAEYAALTGGGGGAGGRTATATTSSSSSDQQQPSSSSYYRLVLPPESDPLLCGESRGIADYSDPAENADVGFDPDSFEGGGGSTIALLVPRGGCSFESKARSAQRLGASVVLVRNTLDSRYGLVVDDEEAAAAADVVDGGADDDGGGGGPDWSNTRWPIGGYDYECGGTRGNAAAARNGFGWRSEVDPRALNFDPPPYGDGPDGTNDALLSGPGVDGNLCAIGVGSGSATTTTTTTTTFESRCPSMRCLLTGRNGTSNPAHLEACCAWDELQPMGDDDGEDDGDAIPPGTEEDITIPALFVTMEKGYELYDLVMDAIAENAVSVGSVKFVAVVPYGRYRPAVHYSTMLLWALAIFALWVSSRRSAKEYEESWSKISGAVSDGVLVLQRRDGSTANGGASHPPPTGGGGRRRANTDDTDADDSDDEGDGGMELRFAGGTEVEMTGTTTTTTATTAATTTAAVARATSAAGTGVDGGFDGLGGETAAAGAAAAAVVRRRDDDDFTIADESNSLDEDDFVGSPAASAKREARGNNAADVPPPLSTSDNGGSSFAPVGSFRAEEEEEEEAPATARQERRQRQSVAASSSNRSVEFKGKHVVFLILAATSFLFLLFFFDLQKIVLVLYGILGSVAVTQVVVLPTYEKASSKFVCGGGSARDGLLHSPAPRWLHFAGRRWIDVASAATGAILGLAWVAVGLTLVQPMGKLYYWILQNVMGVCLCVVVLGLIHVRTVMVATIVLSLLFVYDVFFVLISPYIFGRSVMLDVATGGSGGVDPAFCEKYPTDPSCRGSLAPLPMLLVIPWFNDYRGGFSMLGLGDIILPGLLISFAARFDSARALVRKCSRISTVRVGEGDEDDSGGGGGGGASSRCGHRLGRAFRALFSGYFGPLVIAYAVGLMVAYVSVWMTRMGQPALLYLVPACLGTLFFLGWRRRELSELWMGPRVMNKADGLVGVARKIPAARAAAAREASNNLADTFSVI